MLTINGKCIKLGSTKIKNFCSSKYTIKGIKKQPKKWEIYSQYIYIQQKTCTQNMDIF